MEKWLRKNVEVGPNRACTGSGVHPSICTQSLHCPPFHDHSVSSHLLAESLVLAGPSQDLPRPPSRQPACQQGCRLCSWRPGLLLEKRQVCLLQSPPRNLNNQWPTTLLAAAASISPPRAGSWVAGRQVEGSWGRLGTRPCLGAELSFRQVWTFLPGGGVGVGWGVVGRGGGGGVGFNRWGGGGRVGQPRGQDRIDWSSHSPRPPRPRFT